MRHPMTPQHTTCGGYPRAYSYCSTSTQAAYSVPLMPSQERIFFPDELDTLLAVEEAEEVRPTMHQSSPAPSLPLPTLPQPNQTQTQSQSRPCFELSSVPTHRYAHPVERSSSGSGEIFKSPPPISSPILPPPQLPLSELASSSTTVAASSATSVSSLAVKKPKRKPAPIVIPPVRSVCF